MTRTTRYTHDCTACIDLGTFEYADDSYDLYYCPEARTVVARYGNAGEEYTSRLDLIHRFSEVVPPIEEAQRRARERGLR